jgi:heme a synthase
VLAVILQGVLGGLTVLYGLPPAISISHGLLAQTFFCIAIALAYLQSETYCQYRPSSDDSSPTVPLSELRSIRSLAYGVVVVVYLQLFAGALMRHNGAGMALLDFPTMGGSWLPSLSAVTIDNANQLRAAAGLPLIGELQAALHLIHRVGGFVVTAAVCLLVLKVAGKRLRGTITQRAGFALLALTLSQFSLGALSILTVREPMLTSLHVAVGAAVLGVSFFLLLSTYTAHRT